MRILTKTIQQTHHQGIWGTNTVKTMIESSKLPVDGLIQQEINVELDVFCAGTNRSILQKQEQDNEAIHVEKGKPSHAHN